MYLSYRNATLFACVVKTQSYQENEKEGLETGILEGGWGKIREGGCEGIIL